MPGRTRYRIRDTSRYALRKLIFVSYKEQIRAARGRSSTSFCFHLLPREVRNIFYERAVISQMRVLSLTFEAESIQEDPEECTYRPVLVRRAINKRGLWYSNPFQGPPLQNTQNVHILRVCRWIWREAAPMLYGQRFRTDNIDVLASFLSRLRPELLGCLREVEVKDGINWYNINRVHDVMNYLVQATALQKLEMHFPNVYYTGAPRMNYQKALRYSRNNQAVFTYDVDCFNEGLGRAFARCIYRKYVGVWMYEVYRREGIGKLSQTFIIKEWQIRCLWTHALGEKYIYWTPWNFQFWQQFDLMDFPLDETRRIRFREAVFAELDELLSQRRLQEDSREPSELGRRRTFRSWLSIDHSDDLPECLIQIP
ncbi:hypothetical protein VP1G_11481 [Cytospora mali]|uniref:Uncharacterized protein n=1 Tax=Cytospora mali TaxID=578113 RepID=A0A194VGP4_CYTMA|nr:hypothetical protein VP1G_11481 [Valsa mali var. pyri (nom. inval.)]